MLTIHRSFVPFAFLTVPFLALVPAPSRAADAEKTLRATVPAHLAAPGNREKERPARVITTSADKERPARVIADADKDRSARARAGSPQQVADKSSRDAHDKVNINTADVKTLMTLTGVGRKVAEKIVAYRDTHGPFKKADELRKVEGVGSGVWEKNRDRVVTK